LTYIKVVNTNAVEIKELSDLAVKIVKEHFDPIIGAAQNDYMIKRFQSVSAITEQLEHGYQYYFVCDSAGNKVGFLAFYLRENELYLSKFYLQKNQRGKGISKDMLNFIVKKAKEAGFSSIVLNVNKNNSAILAYEKLGFIKIREEKNDFGNGFFMDDYVYEYLIE
jgi:ribosomal protein S18 acetylase RimI-like enzyme